jgi:hypothetical protein
MRLEAAVLDNDYLGNKENMLDIKYGSQTGYVPRLGGGVGKNTYSEWINNTAYVKRNIIPFVLQTPKFFELMGGKKKRLQETYIALFETQAETIDGLQSTVAIETDEHIVGAAGEMQEEIIKATRTRSTVSYTFREKAGKPINRFLDFIIRYGQMDPDTQRPLVTKLSTYNGTNNGLYTPDMYSGTILFVEPDFAHKKVQEAWLCTNMFPKSAGEITGKRDLSAAGEMAVYTIEMASITVSNISTRVLGQKLLDKLDILNVDPDQLPLFVDKTGVAEQGRHDNDYNFNEDYEKTHDRSGKIINPTI